jgi:hypothetical protein
MSERSSEPDVAELQRSAQTARDALVSSIARLDDRVKHMRSTAVNATAASAWGIAAACAWWLSFASDRQREAPVRAHHARPALAAVLLTSALKTAGVVLTGALLYASYRRARRLGASTDAAPVRQLSAGESRLQA